MSDDTPTQRFDAPLTPSPPSTPPSVPSESREAEERRRRILMFVFIGLSAALLLALIIVLIVLFTRGSTPTATTTPTTSPSSSPSATASATPAASSTPSAAAPPPASTAPKPTAAPTANGAPVFTNFSIPDATCTGTTGTSSVTMQYSSVGATAAYFGISVANAKEAPTDGPLPPNGPYTFDYQCSNSTQIWVITLVDGAGGTTNKSREVHSGAK